MADKLTIDPDLIRRLAELLKETGLGEIEYAEGERRVRVAMPGTAPMIAAAAAPAPVIAAAAAPAAAASNTPAGALTSPMVGTAYLAPEPNAPHFVKPGDKVREGQTVLIIEAMKVMNAIRAPRAGTVTRILIANGAPVEYGEPLLVIE
ncbi:MAG TPA: acetyl-CoA carboxylase biotin carboxyl carrier protein [Alphaproteobacteria bacterium]|nr:acetyl-CoA carboxylase biotin carboxyl carrier protein [Alphaproteobacteria bacterium]